MVIDGFIGLSLFFVTPRRVGQPPLMLHPRDCLSTYLHSNCWQGVPPKFLIEDDGEYKVRELSGREGLMLMGVEREDVAKIAASGLSDSQMMKLSGNSIVVDVMSSFFQELIRC